MHTVSKYSGIKLNSIDSWGPIDFAISRIVRSVCSGAGPDLVEDCLQEARLCLWLARERLAAMEEPFRSRYAGACIRNAAGRLLRSERNYRNYHTPLTSTCDLTTLPDSQLSDKVIALINGDWLKDLEMPDVAEAVSALPGLEKKILNLYYGHGMTDREIAIETSISTAAVIKRRSRMLHRLRKSAGLRAAKTS
jgi:RNA polymerase sigma factor (sigma-70 family)